MIRKNYKELIKKNVNGLLVPVHLPATKAPLISLTEKQNW